MILKIVGCDKFINFQNNSLNVLFIPEIDELFNFISLFRKEIEEETETLTFFDSDRKLKLDSEVDLQTDLFSLTLNQKKLITWLHKKILKENSNSESMFNFNKVKETILSWLNELKTSTLIDFDYLEDLENTDILKLMKVQFKEKEETLFDRFTNFLDTILGIKKVKLLFVSFLYAYFSEAEITQIKNICEEGELTLVSLEKDKPKFINDKIKVIKYFNGDVLE